MSADSGFFSLQNLSSLEARGIEGYIPDPNLACELNGRGRRRGLHKVAVELALAATDYNLTRLFQCAGRSRHTSD